MSTQWKAPQFDSCSQGPSAERSYLAMLLALHDRDYSIQSSTPDSRIDATYSSNYHPRIYNVRWKIQIDPRGRVLLDSSPKEIERRQAKKFRGWARRLGQTYDGYRCRETEYLRAETRRLGLASD